MTRSITIAGLGCLVLVCTGCPGPESTTGGSSTGDMQGESTSVPTDALMDDAASTTGTADPTTGETCGFLCETTGEEAELCDKFTQDCPEGQKCTAYSRDGHDAWSGTKCVPVMGDGQAGDPCTVQDNAFSGLDDCAKGVMCWAVDEENHGTCLALCTGPDYAPMCAEGFICWLTDEGVLNLCRALCDPLLADCAEGEVCLPYLDAFVCWPDASGEEGQAFDACEFVNRCDPGLICLNPSAASECDPNAGGCCLPYCDVTDPDVTCPGVGQECVAWYEEGMAPPEYAKVGICTLPE